MLRTFLTASFAAGVALASLQAHADDRPSLSIAIQSMGPAGSLDSIENTGTAGRKYLMSIWEQLIALDFTNPDLPMMPGLATEWTWIEPSVLEFTLREGVVFHNGDVMTADDVVFSFSDERFGLLPEQTAARESGAATFTHADGRRGIVPPASVAAQRRSQLPLLDRVVKVDDLTVRFHFESPSLAHEARLGRLNFTSIVSERAAREAESWADFVKNPVGAGPYRVVGLDEGAEIRMVAHDEYYRGRPPLSAITWRVVPEAASRVNGLLSGEYDIISDVNPDQVDLIANASGFAAVGGPVVNIRFLALDTVNEGPLQNRLVRQALSHLVDHDTIVDVLWSGLTNKAPGFQSTFFGDMFVPDYQPPQFDPDRARALLAEAGYNGERINFRTQNDYYPNELTVSQYVLGTMQQAGLNIDFAITDSPNRQSPERMITNLSNTAFFAHPVAIVDSRCAGGSYQTGWWDNAEFQALCEQLRASTDRDEASELMHRMMDIMLHEDPAIIVLHQTAIIYGKRDDIEWEPSTIFVMPFGPGKISFAAN